MPRTGLTGGLHSRVVGGFPPSSCGALEFGRRLGLFDETDALQVGEAVFADRVGRRGKDSLIVGATPADPLPVHGKT